MLPILGVLSLPFSSPPPPFLFPLFCQFLSLCLGSFSPLSRPVRPVRLPSYTFRSASRSPFAIPSRLEIVLGPSASFLREDERGCLLAYQRSGDRCFSSCHAGQGDSKLSRNNLLADDKTGNTCASRRATRPLETRDFSPFSSFPLFTVTYTFSPSQRTFQRNDVTQPKTRDAYVTSGFDFSKGVDPFAIVFYVGEKRKKAKSAGESEITSDEEEEEEEKKANGSSG